ncbi:MAG: hypothetical protein ABI824_10740 [Acidobacteriota bacterium]
MRLTTRHIDDFELALFASRDLPVLTRLRVALHVRGCVECREMVEAFQDGREALRGMMHRLPSELGESSPEWQRLTAEMTANIHLGLEAGECVARVPSARGSQRKQSGSGSRGSWRPLVAGAGIAAAAMFLIGSAWWLNFPNDAALLGGVFERVIGREPLASTRVESREPMVEASTKGIEFRENGGSMGMNLTDSKPVYTSVSFEGSASSTSVDMDTGQVTIAKVYVQ